MRRRLKQWWPVVKAVFTLAILVAIGRQFYRDLQHPDLWNRPLDLRWLLLAAVVYVLGLGCACLFWYRLLRTLGQRPDALATVRSYYISQLGKYLPGRAWALLLRVNLVRGPGVRAGVAGLTAFYEVVTTMATGAFVALVLFVFIAPEPAGEFRWETYRRLFRLQASETEPLDRRVLLLFAFTLFLPLFAAILPAVYNRLARRVTRPFQREDALPLPHVPPGSLVEGMAWTVGFWFLFTVSLCCVLQALLPRPLPWSLGLCVRMTAYVSAAYVAGFVIILVPSGLGIREFFLTLFLVPELGPLLDEDTGQARAVIVLAVLVVRLVWTATELLLSGVLYCLPASLRPAEAPVLAGSPTVHGPQP